MYARSSERMKSERFRAPLRVETSFSLRYSSSARRKTTTRLRGSAVMRNRSSRYACAYWVRGASDKQFAKVPCGGGTGEQADAERFAWTLFGCPEAPH